MKTITFLTIMGIVLAFNGFTSAFVKYYQITAISWLKKSFLAGQEKEENFISHLDNFNGQYNELFQEFCKK